MSEHSGPHILSRFDHALESLRSNVLLMSTLTQRSMITAQTGLFERSIEQCNTVVADDDEIDTLETLINREAVSLIMKFQPVALDLRLVIATIKVSANLERIGDHVVSIARRSRKLLGLTTLPEAAILSSLFQDCTRFLDDVAGAFLRRNPVSLNYLEAAFAALTQRIQIYTDVITRRISYELEQAVNVCIDLVHIAKLLELIVGISREIGMDTHFALDASFTALPHIEIDT